MGKRNRSFLILGGLAAATALAGSASAFWNFFGPESPNTESPAGQQIKADFTNASVDEVFKWLRGQGVNFVVETTQIANRKITMSVTAKNKDALLNAIADALGFSVTKKDGAYVLKQSSPFGAWTAEDGSPGIRFFHNDKDMTPEERAKWEKEFAEGFKGFGDNFKVFGQNFKEMTPEQRAKWEKEFAEGFKGFGDNFKVFGQNFKEMTPEERAKWEKEMGDWGKSFGDNFRIFDHNFKDMTPEEKARFEKEMGEWGKHFGEGMKHFGEGMKMFGGDGKVWENGKQRDMTPEEKARFEKEMSEWGKHFGEGMKHFGEGMKDFHFDFTKELFPKIEKELQDSLKKGTVTENGKERPMTKEERAEIEKAIKELRENSKNFPKNFYGMSDEDRKKFEKEMEEFHKNMKDLPRFHDMKFHEGLRLDAEGIKELKASLTQAQKDLMKKNGHLTPKDLTDAQRKMIGLEKTDGDFDITINSDGFTLKIKSK